MSSIGSLMRNVACKFAAIAVTALIIAAPAAAKSLEEIKTSGQIRIGLLVDFPP